MIIACSMSFCACSMPRCAVLDVPHGKSHHGDIVVQGLPIALIEHKSSGKTGGVLCLSGGGVVISSEKLYTEGFLPTPILAVVGYSDHGSGLARVDAKPLAVSPSSPRFPCRRCFPPTSWVDLRPRLEGRRMASSVQRQQPTPA